MPIQIQIEVRRWWLRELFFPLFRLHSINKDYPISNASPRELIENNMGLLTNYLALITSRMWICKSSRRNEEAEGGSIQGKGFGGKPLLSSSSKRRPRPLLLLLLLFLARRLVGLKCHGTCGRII